MATSPIASALAGIRTKYMNSAGGEGLALQEMSNYLANNGISAEAAAQAANQIAPNGGWTADRVNQTMAQYAPTQYGLGPAMGSLSAAGRAATDRINQTQDMVSGLYGQAQGYLDPYRESGEAANQLQAALSGAMGPRAQQEAFAQYNQSPGTEFMMGEAERAIMRNAAATGGLGGGNLLRELQANALGLAQQDYGNYFSRLGDVANRGYGAATTGAGLRGNEAGTQAGLGQYAASIPLQVANSQAQMQFQAGRDLSNNYGQIGTNLANTIGQQGAGLSSLFGNYGNNISNLISQSGQQNQSAGLNFGNLLANLNSNAAGQVAGMPLYGGQQTNYTGQLGGLASGIGNLLGALS